jgi:hypothetical protein
LIFYTAAVIVFLIGQVHFFQQNVSPGIFHSLIAILIVFLEFMDFSALAPNLLRVGQKIAVLWRTLQQAWQKLPGKPVSLTGTEGVDLPAVFKAKAQPEALNPAWLRPCESIVLHLPKIPVITLGGLIITASQWFLYQEKIFLGVTFFLLGGFLVYKGVQAGPRGWRLGNLAVIIKFLLLALPGFLFLVGGSLFLYFKVHTNAHADAVGLGLNALGVLLLLKLLPAKFEDPLVSSEGRVLDGFGRESRSMREWIFKIALASVGLLLLFFFIKNYAAENYTPALVLGLLGTAALLFSFPLGFPPQSHPHNFLLRLPTAARMLLRLLAFALGLYLAYLAQVDFSRDAFAIGFTKYLWAGFCMLLAWREPSAYAPDPLLEKKISRGWELLGLSIILVAAAWLRLRSIATIPYGIECDEAGGTINALEMREHFSSLVAHPVGAPLFTLLPRLVSITLFGLDNLGVKADAIFFGLVGIVAMYFICRCLWGPRIALGVAALMALSRWHIHFSRFGFTNTFFITLLMLAFFFLIKALQTRKKLFFFLSGINMAFVIQSETAGRLIPIIAFGIMLYFAWSQRQFFQRNWKPIAAMLLGAWLAGSGIITYFVKYNHILLKRVQEVSIYSKDVNAPVSAAKGMIDNVRVSLGMLNWHGDYRGRHNGGMSGEPVLDFWTAILFALGLLYTLYYWRRWRYGILLFWFFGFMAASVFSIEAPQSHRAFGLYPAAFLMVGAVLDRSRRLLTESLGKMGWWAGILAFCILLVPVAKINYRKYFETLPAFDSNCTLSARYVGAFPPKEWETVFMSAYFWQGHPPFQLYARNISGRFYYYANTALPYRLPEIKGVVYALVLEYQPLLPTIQWFYPKGVYTEETHPKYGIMFKGWAVPAEEIARTRGLQGNFWNNPDCSGTPVLTRKENTLNETLSPKNWPLPGVGGAMWRGSLWIPREGMYTFYLSSTDFSQIRIGNTFFLESSDNRETSHTVYLPAGLHRFRARAQRLTKASRLEFSWSSQSLVTYFLYKMPHRDPFTKEIFPANYLFTYPDPVGLLETFYQTPDWKGKIASQQIQPALCYLSGFSNAWCSITWQGSLHIAQPGNYQFQLESDDFSELWIDDRLVYYQGQNPLGLARPMDVVKSLTLTPGEHRVFGRLSSKGGGYKLWWIPPNQTRELVPASVLTPAEP